VIEDIRDLFKPFNEQLKAGKWETIIRIHDDEQIARVSMLRKEGKIQGVFVTVTDGESVLLANLVCDVAPEKVQQFTAALTKIAMKMEFHLNNLPITITPSSAIVLENGVTVAPAIPVAPPSPPVPPAAVAVPPTIPHVTPPAAVPYPVK
jgi:hypothetical protein